VTLVSGPTSLPAPRGVDVIPVETAEEMEKALTTRFAWSTVVIMAAAVADFRPARTSNQKLKKGREPGLTLGLERTEDILTLLSKRKSHQVLVGFAAETEAVKAHAEDKLKRKGLDLIVGNNVAAEGSGFGSDTNAAVLIDRDGQVTECPLMPKRELADRILDAVRALSRSSQGGGSVGTQ
jgi:phosphopantothenoylcysteine decarboxylase/phosphopantothenate--cysteine ligase